MKSKLLVCWTVWILFLALGFSGLYRYTYTAGRPADVHAHAREKIEREPASQISATLLLFLHPQCPCSEATVSELETLLPKMAPSTVIKAYLYKARNLSDDWVRGSLWNRLSAIHNVSIIVDDDGKNAESFGVYTSGQVLFYSEEGDLVFAGGLTAGRGHVGDNPGSDAIAKYFKDRSGQIAVSPVFGCSLKNPERAIAGTTP